ncbi:ComEC/Rec2 family competence protein [Roseimaritima sediminicola]|uniref:ComEC/Rec2 family competence protein n=1 Tax=Roseimaritima sediminicola TaxID=2662066 RepID=UPI0012984763|nr:ComEC/Rec2 family competence protein [Roseimaritima sediminicola]
MRYHTGMWGNQTQTSGPVRPSQRLADSDRADRHLLRRHPMITLAMAAAAGIQGGLWSPRFTILAASAAALLWVLHRRAGHPRVGWLAAMGSLAAAFSIHAAARYEQHDHATLPTFLRPDPQPVVLRATVTSMVERRPNTLARLQGRAEAWQSMFDARVTELRAGTRWVPVEGGVKVIVDAETPYILPGDRLRVMGKLQPIEGPRNPGEPDLRARQLAAGRHAHLLVDSPSQVHRLETATDVRRPFARLSNRGEQILAQHLPPSTRTLAAALVLGRREAVARSTRELLLETGTAHLLSVSGLHLGIVALAAAWLLAATNLSQNKQYLGVFVICVVYAAVTGGRPPVMRAALLVGALLLGAWSGRLVHPLNALALAALGLLWWDPANLSAVGVHLSFLAVGTLILASRGVSAMAARGQAADPLDRLLDARLGWLRRGVLTALRRIRLALWFSFWVWAITAPLVWFHFHILSPVSILANVLLGLPLMVALISGLATVACGLALDPLATLPAAVCHGSLTCMLWIIETIATVPGGHRWLPSPPGPWVAGFYGVLAGGLLLPRRWPRVGLLLSWLGVWMLVALPLATLYCSGVQHPVPTGTLEATFIDVGHGTSVLIRQDDGTVWLYDCGRLGDPAFSSRPIQSVLWHYGIWRLDAVVLSHADADHYNALPGLLRRFGVRRVITPPGMLETDEPGLHPLRVAIADAGVEVIVQHAGQTLALAKSPSSTTIYHPPPQRMAGSDNANSLVLGLQHAGRVLLLPGDLESPGTERLLEHPRPPGGGILMAPHHGSLQQDPRPLLDWARPRTVIVSGSRRAGQPAVLETLGRNGADVHVTALEGALRTRIDSEGRVTVSAGP